MPAGLRLGVFRGDAHAALDDRLGDGGTDAIVGGDDAVAGSWLKNHNVVLDAEPIALIQTVPGLMNVIQYLDARRAVV